MTPKEVDSTDSTSTSENQASKANMSLTFQQDYSHMNSNGQYPSNAMTSHGWIIQVYHRETVVKLRLRYKIGFLRDKDIVWSDRFTSFNRGFYPRVAVNEKGMVVVVFSAQVGRRMYFRLGKLKNFTDVEPLNVSAAVNEVSIKWLSADKELIGEGRAPDITINNKDEIIVAYDKGNLRFHTHYRIGDIVGEKVVWRKNEPDTYDGLLIEDGDGRLAESCGGESGGGESGDGESGDCRLIKSGTSKNVSIAMNDRGDVVVGYASGIERAVHFVSGYISTNNNSIMLREEGKHSPPGVQYQPVVSLNNHGQVVVVHYHLHGRIYLKYNCGLIKPNTTTGIEWSLANSATFASEGCHASVVVNDSGKVVATYKHLTLVLRKSIRNRIGEIAATNSSSTPSMVSHTPSHSPEPKHPPTVVTVEPNSGTIPAVATNRSRTPSTVSHTPSHSPASRRLQPSPTVVTVEVHEREEGDTIATVAQTPPTQNPRQPSSSPKHQASSISESSLGVNMSTDPKFPGIIFYTDPIQQTITSQGIQCKATGISVTIPEQALSPTELEKGVDIVIRPCFQGPFEFPADYEAASPIYLVETSREVEIRRDMTLQIHHYTSLQSEEDCAEMMFVSASSSPQHQQNSPSYVFEAVKESEEGGGFRRRSHMGKILMRHFSLIGIVRRVIGRRVVGVIPGNTYYSARLYRRDAEQASPSNSAVFCMCLFQPVYIQHCDDYIAKEFLALSGKSARLVRMEGNEATLSVRNSEGWKVTFDKRPLKITKRDLDLPIQFNVLNDYPPKFIINAVQISPHADSECPQLVVKGLDDECAFGIIIGSSRRISTQSQSGSLTVCNVSNELRSVTEWNSLGLQLGLEYYEMQEIEINYPNSLSQRKETVIARWLKRVPGGDQALWHNLCEALKKLDENVLAQHIEATYCNCLSVC